MMEIIKALKCARSCTKWLYVHALGLFPNDEPGFLVMFMTGSNLFPDASVLVTTYRMSNSAYPQPSGVRYRINGPLVLTKATVKFNYLAECLAQNIQ